MSKNKPISYLTVAEFAAGIKRSRQTVNVWIRSGYITAVRALGPGKQPYLIPEPELERVRASAADTASTKG